MLPLYAAWIEDLGQGDFVKVDCAACNHVALLTPGALMKVGLSPGAKDGDCPLQVGVREMKLIWRNHPEDFIFFVKLYEWSFKILGWLTALGALKFAYVKTGNGLFFAIYAAFLSMYLFPLATVIYFELDLSKLRSPLLKRLLGRLPPLVVTFALAYSLNWAVTHTVDGIANIQLTANCNTSGGSSKASP